MTKEEIIEMAKKAGWSGIYTQWAEPTGEADWSPYKVSLTVPVTIEQIEAFAKLVAEHESKRLTDVAMKAAEKAVDVAMALEREECAKLCEEYFERVMASRIRARGNNE